MATQGDLDVKKGTLSEVLDRIAALGGVPPWRIRMAPPPGEATEADVLAALDGPEKLICELVDGVLVEKPMSTTESILASEIIRLLGNHVVEHDLGVVTGEAGMFKLEPTLIRAPDVAFIPWENIPGEEMRLTPRVSTVSFWLAIEVLCKSNTPAEIDRKLKDYFFHGTRLAWVIDPSKQTAKSYTSPKKFKRISKTGTLDASAVLPGFTLSLPDLFARPRRKRTG